MLYAQVEDVEAYIEGWVTTNSTALGRLIERAELDIDFEARGLVADETTDRKFNPATMTNADAEALMRATCAQVEYRDLMGEDFFVRPQYDGRVEGPDFKMEGKLPRLGPKTSYELAGLSTMPLSIPDLA
jgi:hypothetical protein